ncbi:unnamed protein product [marine sediment metagenome]|uniref:Acriflavin resistance protein n=1 Tax=marine sediment metagenome TaxID=412755 RepID=X0S1C2_9ZZZZ
MTATTTILAMTPLAMGIGEGGDAQAPMARAIIGGLISSNLITLVVIPTVYALIDRRSLKEQSPAEHSPEILDKTDLQRPGDEIHEELI